MTKYLIGATIWGVFAGIMLLVFISMIFTKETAAIIPNGIVWGITLLGMSANLIAYFKTKKKTKQTSTPTISITNEKLENEQLQEQIKALIQERAYYIENAQSEKNQLEKKIRELEHICTNYQEMVKSEKRQFESRTKELEEFYNSEKKYLQSRIAQLETKLNEQNKKSNDITAKFNIETGAPPQSQLESAATRLPITEPISSPQITHDDRIALAAPFSRISKEIIDLLWFLNGPLKNYYGNSNETDFEFAGHTVHIKSIITSEPSAIDINLPLANTAAPSISLGYYPSYERLTAQQRTTYLNWLTDITLPIDIGYVFIFYYGLERHLLFGNAESALATIFILRQFHENKSFLNYSGDAVVLYTLIHKRWDILQNIDVEQLSADMRLFVVALVYHSFGAQDIINSYKKFGFENNRYIKNESDLFLSTLDDLLIDKYNTSDYPIYLDDFASAQGNIQLVLANYSLLPEQRFLELPDITTSPRVHKEINLLLTNTHEIVKAKLRELRKGQ